MVNLLPHTARRIVAFDYRMRLTATALLFAAAACLLGAALLLPAYFIMVATNNYALVQSELVRQTLMQKTLVADAADETATAHLLAAVSGNADAPRFSLITENIVGARPAGVKLQYIEYASRRDGISVRLSGVADTRESLLAFRGALSQVPQLSAVTLPVDNLAKPTDISFTLTATYATQ